MTSAQRSVSTTSSKHGLDRDVGGFRGCRDHVCFGFGSHRADGAGPELGQFYDGGQPDARVCARREHDFVARIGHLMTLSSS